MSKNFLNVSCSSSRIVLEARYSFPYIFEEEDKLFLRYDISYNIEEKLIFKPIHYRYAKILKCLKLFK